jgi:hypothetical protein
MYIDTNTLKVATYAMTPFAQGTATLGNKMETVITSDGLMFLYIMRHSGQEFWRTLIYC